MSSAIEFIIIIEYALGYELGASHEYMPGAIGKGYTPRGMCRDQVDPTVAPKLDALEP